MAHLIKYCNFSLKTLNFLFIDGKKSQISKIYRNLSTNIWGIVYKDNNPVICGCLSNNYIQYGSNSNNVKIISQPIQNI